MPPGVEKGACMPKGLGAAAANGADDVVGRGGESIGANLAEAAGGNETGAGTWAGIGAGALLRRGSTVLRGGMAMLMAGVWGKGEKRKETGERAGLLWLWQ